MIDTETVTDTLEFYDVALGDRAAIEEFLRRYPTRRLNYCFPVLYLWGEACEFQIAFHDGFMLVKTFIDCHHNFLYPLGEGDLCGTVEQMIEYGESRGCRFRLFQIPPDKKETIETCFPDRFEFAPRREEAEYIYTSERLATLTGREMQHKRNHLNHFEQSYDWQFEHLSSANIEVCRAFNRRWFEEKREAGELDATLEAELHAIEKAFDEWSALGFDGAILHADGEPVAYAVGCPLAGDTYLVLFEKSLHHIRGASQQINKLFVQAFATGYTYVNRAEDGGDEGLRQAKLSYHPDILEEVWSARLKK